MLSMRRWLLSQRKYMSTFHSWMWLWSNSQRKYMSTFHSSLLAAQTQCKWMWWMRRWLLFQGKHLWRYVDSFFPIQKALSIIAGCTYSMQMNVMNANMAIISTEQHVQVWRLFFPHVEFTVENCLWYKPNANECATCKYGDYLNGTTCASMSTLFSPCRKDHWKLPGLQR